MTQAYSHKIIMNEIEEAEKILQNGFSKKIVNKFELELISKYYFWKGLKILEIKNKIIDFSKKYDENFNEILSRKIIENCLHNIRKYKIKEQGSEVIITVNEMDVIRKLERKYSEILFVMLVIAKHEKFNSNISDKKSYSDNVGYYFKRSFEDAVKLSELKMNTKEMDDAKYYLCGINRFILALPYSYNVWAIKFANDHSEPILRVDNLNNIISFLPYFCTKCGAQIEKRSHMRHDLCDDCYKTQRREYLTNAKRKERENKKDNVSF